VYVPLPRRTSDAEALAITQLVAGRVAKAHPTEATVIRGLRGRGAGTVYIDCLQNARGKTVAAAYCVRPVDGARVSMPLRWSELTASLDQHAFTIRTAPGRIARLGDVWTDGMKRNSARAVREALGFTGRSGAPV
jgi:bifunctional non-homologous end joining protein LigD